MGEGRGHVDDIVAAEAECSIWWSAARISTSWRWSAPLGSPDVPEVNRSCAI